MTAKHFQNNIFCTRPLWKFADQLHAPNLWHGEIKRTRGDCHRNIQAPSADCQHPKGPRSWRVAIGAKQCFTWFAKVLHMDRMTHSIPWPAEPQPESLTCALQK